MSLFSGIEKAIEREFRRATERVFGPAECDQLILVHRGILEQIEARVQTGPGGVRLFPFNFVKIRLASAGAARRTALEAALTRERRLENDIREFLTTAGCRLAPGFTVDVAGSDAAGPAFTVECGNREVPAPARAPARLQVIRGKANQPEFIMERPRINIGRLAEITDSSYRVIRRNDVVFEEGADPANATVSRAHAHIVYDGQTGEYRIADEGSEYGTRLFRDGRSIEVPRGSLRGERLRPGDEIYLGRACLSFTLAPA
jgi:hypothetical protein